MKFTSGSDFVFVVFVMTSLTLYKSGTITLMNYGGFI